MSPPLTLGESIKLSGKMEILDADKYYEEKKNVVDQLLQTANIECKYVNIQAAGRIYEHFKKDLNKNPE